MASGRELVSVFEDASIGIRSSLLFGFCDQRFNRSSYNRFLSLDDSGSILHLFFDAVKVFGQEGYLGKKNLGKKLPVQEAK